MLSYYFPSLSEFRRYYPVFKLSLILLALSALFPAVAIVLIPVPIDWISQIGLAFGLIAYFCSFALLGFGLLLGLVGIAASLFYAMMGQSEH